MVEYWFDSKLFKLYKCSGGIFTFFKRYSVIIITIQYQTFFIFSSHHFGANATLISVARISCYLLFYGTLSERALVTFLHPELDPNPQPLDSTSTTKSRVVGRNPIHESERKGRYQLVPFYRFQDWMICVKKISKLLYHESIRITRSIKSIN